MNICRPPDFHSFSFASFFALAAFLAPLRAQADLPDTIFGSGMEPNEVIAMSGPCNGFYRSGFTLEEGALTPQIDEISKPAKGVVVSDPGFQTCMVRSTVHTVEPPVTFARNDYSRRQAFNADRSLFLVYSYNGYWHLYDADTLAYVKVLNGPAGDAEPQWHPTDPNKLYYLPSNGGLKIFSLNVQTNTTQTAANFSGRLPWSDVNGLWTKDEGSPSRDGRYWGFQAEANFNIRGFVVYDLQQDTIVGTRNVSIRPDHVSMTPSGRWFTSSGDTEGTWAWSRDFTQKKKLHHKSEHSDLAVGPNGHDYYVSIDYQSNAGDVFAVDIDNCPAVAADATDAPECPRIVLFPTYINGAATAMHFSGKAYDKPGWVLISTYQTGPTRDGIWPWYTDKIFAVELNSSPRIYGVGFHHVDDYEGYWTEPHASVSRDFSHIMFNSNWNTTSDNDVDDYMIQLPDVLPTAQP